LRGLGDLGEVADLVGGHGVAGVVRHR
jgi:hypothetical protein